MGDSPQIISFAFGLSPAFAGLKICCAFKPWGLRPRLYASACSAGLDPTLCPGLLSLKQTSQRSYRHRLVTLR